MDDKTRDIFGQEFGTSPRKLVRTNDPETSHEAAGKVDTTILERMVYNAIVGYGNHGCISDDVQQIFSHLPYSSVTARYKALSEKGLIIYTGEKRPGRSGRSQRVMVAQ